MIPNLPQDMIIDIFEYVEELGFNGKNLKKEDGEKWDADLG